jgi:hypothetical protein
MDRPDGAQARADAGCPYWGQAGWLEALCDLGEGRVALLFGDDMIRVVDDDESVALQHRDPDALPTSASAQLSPPGDEVRRLDPIPYDDQRADLSHSSEQVPIVERPALIISHRTIESRRLPQHRRRIRGCTRTPPGRTAIHAGA